MTPRDFRQGHPASPLAFFITGASLIVLSQFAMAWLSGQPRGALRYWQDGRPVCVELVVEPAATEYGVAFHDGLVARNAGGQWEWRMGGECDE